MKMLIIGGQTGLEFAKFVKEASGGSIEVNSKYTSLSIDESDLKNNLIRADKFVYIISESKNMKNDLRVLNQLMSNRTFFNVKEMFIFGISSDNVNECIKNYKVLMSEQKFDNYYINVEPNPVPFNVMYNSIMGIVDEGEEVTKFKKVYRATRNDSSKRGYEPKHYNKIIEPSVEDRVEAYEKIKEASKKVETGRPIRDEEEKYPPNIQINLVNLNEKDTKSIKDIMFITGREKSGTSAFSSCIVRELVARNMKVLLIDLSYSKGSIRMVSNQCKNFFEVDNLNILCGDLIPEDDNVIAFKVPKKEIMLEYLMFVLKLSRNIDYNFIIIDCDLFDSKRVLNLVNNRILRTIITCENIKEELELLKVSIDNCEIKDGVIYLNNSIKFDKTCSIPSPVFVRNNFSGFRIIKSVDLSRNLKICEALGV